MPRRLSSIEPSGSIKPFAGGSIPSGYLACDGTVVSQATFSALFASLGTAFNTGGEGAGNFRLPDLRGKSPLGDGQDVGRSLTNRVRGTYQGEENHILSVGELATHTHTGSTNSDGTHTHQNAPAQCGSTNLGNQQTIISDVVGSGGGTPTVQPATSAHSHAFTTAGQGSSLGHNNMHPYCVIKFIIKT